MPRRRRIPRPLKDLARKWHQEGVTHRDIQARFAVLGCCVSLSRIAGWFSHAQQNVVRDSDVNEEELENVEELPAQPAASAAAAAAAAAAALFPHTVLNLDEAGFRSAGFNSRAPHGDQVFNYMCQNLYGKRLWCTKILGFSDIGLSSASDDTDYSDMPELEGSHEDDDSMPPLIDELSENIDRVYEELEETNQDSEQDL